mmetsp:Transcript_46844/g.56680  ORF Transcript_46844/g.56680 Transcript_46844/m.56680 type:complete len:227 (+) Transcript_46844:16-696(+)
MKSENPFVQMLEHGQGKDGYWTYNHMVVQIEDVIDTMVCLYPDPNDPTRCMFNICFELDHSSGHAKDQENGLSTVPSIISISHGGSQRKMRPTKLTEGCFGTVQHPQRLKIGDVQQMVFCDSNLPPISDPTCPKYNTPTGKFVKKELVVSELRTALVRNELNSDGLKEKLVERCIAAGIATKKTVQIEEEGYVGKAKGALQVAYERGFCDANQMLNGVKVSARSEE